MKIIASYVDRTQAEEDRTMLMHKGIASVVHGDVAPRAMTDHFQKVPITLVVQDLQARQARELLRLKYHPDPIPRAMPKPKKNISE